MQQHDDDHDQGFVYDLKVMAAMVERRRALKWFAGAGTAALVASCGGGGSSDAVTVVTGTTPTPTPTSTSTATPIPTPTATSGTTACIADPAETAGPYPADGTNSASGSTSNSLTVTGIVRSDIRPSFISGTTVATGVQLVLTLTLVDVNASCAPLAGYALYLWHCDRSGNYSLYTAAAESYLRGVQVTNAAGQVTFTTIFPACYDGRFPHIHLEIFPSLSAATTGRAASLVTQIYPPRDVCTAVYNGATGYSTSVTNLARVTLASDNVFGDNSAAQVAQMAMVMSGSVSTGYTATNTIGIAR